MKQHNDLFLDRDKNTSNASISDGLYAQSQQPPICHQSLRLLQDPPAMTLPRPALKARLERFPPPYDNHHRLRLMPPIL